MRRSLILYTRTANVWENHGQGNIIVILLQCNLETDKKSLNSMKMPAFINQHPPFCLIFRGHVDFYPNFGIVSQPGCEQKDVLTLCT